MSTHMLPQSIYLHCHVLTSNSRSRERLEALLRCRM
jgi:hypothetical protein